MDAATPERAQDGPPLEAIESLFPVYEIRVDGETIRYYGTPKRAPEPMMRELWGVFREAGYDVRLTVHHGEYVLEAEPIDLGIDGIPWTNVVLFLATVASTLFAGAMWYGIDPIAEPTEMWRAWPFSLAILFVLGVHEMGHYVLSRHHRVDASLPYFLPVPTLIGTMGAVIKMKGHMPNRKALFDIGVAGPLAGLVATVAVTVVGLYLPPVPVPEGAADPDATQIQLGFPPMLELIAAAVNQPLYTDDPTQNVNPVVIGGWVGMFVTFLNLIPVGQLDGGHILRAMAGRLQETIAALVPGALFVLAAGLYYVGDYSWNAVFIWIFWGFFAVLLAAAGPAVPMDDDRLDRKRFVLGIVTFALGVLCFMPAPVEIIN